MSQSKQHDQDSVNQQEAEVQDAGHLPGEGVAPGRPGGVEDSSGASTSVEDQAATGEPSGTTVREPEPTGDESGVTIRDTNQSVEQAGTTVREVPRDER